MTQIYRLDEGGRIDRARPARFTFDGRVFTGLAGDTLASALLANGVHLMGRSFKYHRPRGIVGAGVDEPNALVELDRGQGRYDCNVQATNVEIYDGLNARSQNRWPSLRFDVGGINNMVASLIPAGFYYKTFMWPRSAWKSLYEPQIRKAAGLGRPPVDADPDRYALQYDHCDILIVGAGPAGLAAALAASEGDARVILCDEGCEFGGSLLSDPSVMIDGLAASQWIERTVGELAVRPNVTLLSRTTASRYGIHNMVSLAERVSDHRANLEAGGPRQRLRQVRAGHVILATGAHERPVVFKGNDRPGVMLASAARTYANRYAVRLGREAVLVTRTDSAYLAAFDLVRLGLKIVVMDLRPAGSPLFRNEAGKLGVEIVAGAREIEAKGKLHVKSIGCVTADGTRRSFACDLVLMAGGWTPAVHLYAQSRSELRWDPACGAYLPGTAVQPVSCAGACQGDFNLAAALASGFDAGAKAVDRPTPDQSPRCSAIDLDYGLEAVPNATAVDTAMAFVDFQNDVTSKDIRLAIREGFHSVEHFKRYTTTGMATDQGRTSNLNAMSVAAEALNIPTGQVGITTFRPPYTPVTFGTLAGYNRGETFVAARLTPSHDWAVARGAVFEDAGLWKRARYFPQAGEDMEAAVRRECRTVRTTAGILDASTLGKIEVVGPDAATFMERMYVNAWSKLKVGGCRYGLLLKEDGYLFDDGVVGRIAEDRFHVTTTTGGAAGVFNLMEDYLQTEWPDLDVWLTSTTEQWAVIAVQGPRARAVLAPLLEDIDLSNETFPHMSVREGRICGIHTRLFRVSFTGELGFEVNVPSVHGAVIWEAIWAEGKKHGAAPYGTEAIHVLRAEKGFVIVGQETDGTVTIDDLGLSWAVGKAKSDFVGKRSLTRSDLTAPGRKQLVGLIPVHHYVVPDEGAQLVSGTRNVPASSEGHITSAYWSEAVNSPIALALLRDGRARLGEKIDVTSIGGPSTQWRVTEPVFFDPEGTRLNG